MRGISRHAARAALPRHRHRDPYAALVLTGSFQEAGDAGRVRVEAGDVLIHGWFEAHRDLFDGSGATVLNLPLEAVPGMRFGRIADPDSIARLAERDPRAASERLIAELGEGAVELGDWPDLLARSLRDCRRFGLGDWARDMGLAPASVSRGFAQAYGVSPQRYRAEQRALRAVRELGQGAAPLAWLADELGFADQAHMSRAVRQLTGLSPRRWRVKYVQEASARAR